jgi:hypothetical protein
VPEGLRESVLKTKHFVLNFGLNTPFELTVSAWRVFDIGQLAWGGRALDASQNASLRG